MRLYCKVVNPNYRGGISSNFFSISLFIYRIKYNKVKKKKKNACHHLCFIINNNDKALYINDAARCTMRRYLIRPPQTQHNKTSKSHHIIHIPKQNKLRKPRLFVYNIVYIMYIPNAIEEHFKIKYI